MMMVWTFVGRGFSFESSMALCRFLKDDVNVFATKVANLAQNYCTRTIEIVGSCNRFYS